MPGETAVISYHFNGYLFKKMINNIINSLIDNCDMGPVNRIHLFPGYGFEYSMNVSTLADEAFEWQFGKNVE
jgi:hypothetical protein